MADSTRGVILVGHGGIPKGFPGELVTKLKRLEAQRRAAAELARAGPAAEVYQRGRPPEGRAH